MRSCAEYDVRLSLRAAGALEPGEAAEVEAHLAGCAACRAEAEGDAAVLAAVRLSPASDAERDALRELPARTVGAYRAMERARGRTRRASLAAAGGLALAASALLALALPGLRTPRLPTSTATATATPTSTSTSTATSTATPTATPTAAPTATPTAAATPTATPRPARWTAPDLDTLWDDSSVVAIDPTAAAAYADDAADDDDAYLATELTLAAWDDAEF